MATYAVFEHRVFGRKAVKNGFAAGAGGFPIIWALNHKMWSLALLFFLWAVVATSMNYFLSNINKTDLFGFLLAQILFYHLAAFFIVGFLGNSILRSRLLMQGYQKISEIEAMSPEDALAKMASLSPAVQHSSPAPSQSLPTDLAAQISKLNDLRKQGALTDEEYQSAKTRLLKN